MVRVFVLSLFLALLQLLRSERPAAEEHDSIMAPESPLQVEATPASLPSLQVKSELQPADGFRLLKAGASCKSPDLFIDDEDTLEECAISVKAAGGKFFKYGKGWFRGGQCYMEYTSSSECPEGFDAGNFDFYDIPDVPLSEAVRRHVDVVLLEDELGSVTLQGEALELQPVVIARRHRQVSYFFSLFKANKWCDTEYRLALHGGASVVETWESCCTGGSGCTPTVAKSLKARSTLDEAGTPIKACSRKDDVSFTLAMRTAPTLPTVQKKQCIEAKVAARLVTFRNLINQCSWVVRAGLEAISGVASLAHSIHSTFFPDAPHNKLIAKVLGKDADSSSLKPETFDEYTLAMFVAVVHLSVRNFQGALRPASERVHFPDERRFLDRFVMYQFIGMPGKEIDADLPDRLSPEQACLIDAIREFPVQDALTDPKNTWEHAVEMGGCPDGRSQCTKKEFVLGSYSKYSTKDGQPAYPDPTVGFGQWWVNGMWKDEAETYLAWSHWGTHLLEAVAGVEGAAFAIRTNVFGGLKVREGFGRVGADMYFSGEGLPVMIETPDKQRIWRNEADPALWQYWKFVWRSSAFLRVTLVDHLWATHFTAANAMAAAAREALSPAHPLRRLLTMFTFGSIDVNLNAFHQLLGPLGLLHRSTPFEDFGEVAKAARQLIPPLKERFEIFTSASAKEKLPPEIEKTRYVQDGQIMFDALRKLVDDFFSVYGESWCAGGKLVDSEIVSFFDRLEKWSMYEDHISTDEAFLGLLGDDGNSLSCQGVRLWLAVHFFHVTGYHRHVGTVGESAADPDFAGFSWKDGEAFTRPRQAMQLSLISASTATRWPKLSESYSFLAVGIEKSAEVERVFQEFQAGMQALKRTVERRNEGTATIPYLQMHPDYVECSVAV